MDKFLNIHEIVQEAAIDSKHQGAMEQLTFRIPLDLKESLYKICKNHGITPSDFFRKCAEVLVKDYQG